MDEPSDAGGVGASWSAPKLTLRCCICGKTDEGQDTGRYTDGICTACLWTHYTDQAVPVLTLMVNDGKPLW